MRLDEGEELYTQFPMYMCNQTWSVAEFRTHLFGKFVCCFSKESASLQNES